MTIELVGSFHSSGTSPEVSHNRRMGHLYPNPPRRWRVAMLLFGMLCGLLFSGCGLVQNQLLGHLESPLQNPLESSLEIDGDRSSSDGFSFSDSTIALAGVASTSEAWTHHHRNTSWETATIPGTPWNNFEYSESSWTFGSDGHANVPDGGARYRSAKGREIILVGDTGPVLKVPDPDGVNDEFFSKIPPRLTFLAGTSLTLSTIGAGQFHGLGLEVGLRWREPIDLFDQEKRHEGNASLQWIAEYTLGHARSFLPKSPGGERTERANFLLGYTPADSNISLQLGWRMATIHQYGGLDQTLDFSGPVVQLGWEFGPKRKVQEESEEQEFEETR